MSSEPINSRKKKRKGKKQQKAQGSAIPVKTPASEMQELPSFVTEHKFEEVPASVISPQVKRVITEMGISRMTEIQYRTMEAMGLLKESKLDPTKIDILGRARTGTGKTIAFLLPTLYHLRCVEKLNTNQISVLIVSPTRELATQISDQAKELIKYTGEYSVQVMYGGTSVKADLSQIRRRVPTILVATPGRLKDHLENSQIHELGSFSNLFRETKIGILDEADQLLEMGFRHDIMSILSYLPQKEKRQTLLFSATVPDQLKEIMGKAMRKDYITVDCIRDGSAETSLHVQQSYAILPAMDRIIIGVLEVIQRAQQDPAHKIIVFFPVARLVAYFEELFQVIGMNVLGIHSRKAQNARNKVSEQFRKAKNAVLLSSDVSARGVDYPDVSHVIQVGLPDSKEQYIHRLGRTGRGGKEGIGWLVLAPFEAIFIEKDLKGVDCARNEDLSKIFSKGPTEGVNTEIKRGLKQVNETQQLRKTARLAYAAWLGFYLSNTKRVGQSKASLVSLANEFASYSGLAEQPSLTPQLVGKMGLKGIPGIIKKADEEDDNGRFRGRGGGTTSGKHNRRFSSSPKPGNNGSKNNNIRGKRRGDGMGGGGPRKKAFRGKS